MEAFIGIDLGGTNIKGIVVDRSGHIYHQQSIPTLSSQGWRDTVARMAGLIVDLKQRDSSIEVAGVGITAPGIIDSLTGTIELMPNFPDDWKGVHLTDVLRINGISALLLNDARAASFGEKMFGAGRAFRNFICMTVGTGIGGGIVHNDHLLLGSRGVAGEIGHIIVHPQGTMCGCGSVGCLETISSGPAISATAARYILQGNKTAMREMIGGDINKLSAQVVCDAAEQGDSLARSVLDRSVTFLCLCIRNLMITLNPEAIIFGGGVSQSDYFLKRIRETLGNMHLLFSEELGGVQIVRAHFDVNAGAIGAAAWAMCNK